MTSEPQTVPRVIESAAASTACQTCDSKFAYALTAGVLGFIALIAVGIALLVFAAIATMDTPAGDHLMDNGYHSYDYGWDDEDFGWSRYSDELEELQGL